MDKKKNIEKIPMWVLVLGLIFFLFIGTATIYSMVTNDGSQESNPCWFSPGDEPPVFPGE